MNPSRHHLDYVTSFLKVYDSQMYGKVRQGRGLELESKTRIFTKKEDNSTNTTFLRKQVACQHYEVRTGAVKRSLFYILSFIFPIKMISLVLTNVCKPYFHRLQSQCLGPKQAWKSLTVITTALMLIEICFNENQNFPNI